MTMLDDILSEVSLKRFKDPSKQLFDTMGGEHGEVWLHQFNLLMRKERTFYLNKHFLEELCDESVWKDAEEWYGKKINSFGRKGSLWYRREHWPFQIAVLTIGGDTEYSLRKKLISHGYSFYEEQEAMFALVQPKKEKTKIRLIRLDPRLLGYYEDATAKNMNQDHPKFHLSLCPPETAYYLFQKIEEHARDRSIVAMNTLLYRNEFPKTLDEHLLFSFGAHNNGSVYLSSLRYIPGNVTDGHWIYQFTG